MPAVDVTDPVVPIFAAVGKDMPVAGAKVEIRSGGVVVATGTTGDGGVALIKAAGLPAEFGVRISGGTVNGKASKAVLLSHFDPESRLASADLVTTLVERFKTQTGTTDWTAEYMTMKSLGLLTEVDTVGSRFSTNSRFDGSKFIAAADKKGGLDKYMKFLIPQIDKGKKFSFRGTVQQRSTSSDLLADAAGDLGGYLGLSSPGADIQKKAQEAAQSLQKAFTDMLAMEWKTQILVNQATYTTETSKVSDFESGVKLVNDKWQIFVQTDVKDPGYAAYRGEIVNDIRKNVNNHYAQVENYFPATTPGVLKAGHAVFQSMYGYYLPGDVTQLQGMVGYWETIASAGNLYIVNMMSYDTATKSNIDKQNQLAKTFDTRILKAMPASLSGPEVGIWKLNRAYKMNSYDYIDYKLITDMAENKGACSGWKGGYSGTGSAKYITRDELNARYKKMVPSGYQWAGVADSSYFSAIRTDGKSVIDVIHNQDKQIMFLVYNDSNTILGQSHKYSKDGVTHHDWEGETVCNATDLRNGGTTINNSPDTTNAPIVSAMVYRAVTLTVPDDMS